VFTGRYALSPYIKQIRFVFKGLLRALYEQRYKNARFEMPEALMRGGGGVGGSGEGCHTAQQGYDTQVSKERTLHEGLGVLEQSLKHVGRFLRNVVHQQTASQHKIP
jgi:hypothetical protein